MTCEGCLLFASNGACDKLVALIETQAKNVGNKKIILFLNYQISRLDKVHCKVKPDEDSFEDVEVQSEKAVRYYQQFLSDKISWVAVKPLSILRRKFPVFVAVPAAVKVHCCFKNCPDKACTVRKRGRHCPKQRKISGFLVGGQTVA